MARFVLGITGASGAPYALRVLSFLVGAGHEVHLVVTANGRKVMALETGATPESLAGIHGAGIVLHDDGDLFAPIASGSFRVAGTAIVPCSMSAAGRIASGSGTDLLCRVADVALKEGRPLVIVPRETPFSSIHLRNLLSLSEAGATILPAMPAFYARPSGIDDLVDFIAGRVLEKLGVTNDLASEWGGSSGF